MMIETLQLCFIWLAAAGPLQGWPKKPNPKNPTQKTRKKPTAKNPSYLGFLGFMGFLKKMADFRMNIKNK